MVGQGGLINTPYTSLNQISPQTRKLYISFRKHPFMVDGIRYYPHKRRGIMFIFAA